jgi:hypothetical protein
VEARPPTTMVVRKFMDIKKPKLSGLTYPTT